ncbi:tetratricopeptide repeat protein [Phormidium pseudopriestleyi FRX01]|uniref:Tetratricopeptide repeat protein n=2 Tax=Phormidium TaxID=1198 RepID=A0ABS3FLH3_9CYAN|nr:tetratricopeptide repeat protein [Phormidium pseudopriestleyi FRX01]
MTNDQSPTTNDHRPMTNHQRLLAQQGETARQQGQYDEAIAHFTEAIALNFEYAWAIAHRGETYYQMGQYHKALVDFNRAVELNPNHVWAIAHRGVTYERLERYPETLADLNRVLELKPDYPWAIAYRCRAYEMMGRYEEALQEFDQAIALDETIIKDWVTERGLILSFMGCYSEAMVYYQQALQETPDNHLTLYCIAFTKTRWQGLAAAQVDINKAKAILHRMEKTHDSSAVIYELGGLAALEGQTEMALDYLEKAIFLDYLPRRRALHDLAWLDLHGDPRFQALIAP